jgi:hypothetical protein
MIKEALMEPETLSENRGDNQDGTNRYFIKVE